MEQQFTTASSPSQQQQQQSTSSPPQPPPESAAAIIDSWVDATLKTAISLDPHLYIPQLFWRQGLRPDGRLFGQARNTNITRGVLAKHSLGSALVQFSYKSVDATNDNNNNNNNNNNTSSRHNKTQVLAGVTADIGQPAGHAGDLKITLSTSTGNSNNDNTAALESWLQRLLLQTVDTQQLGIVSGKAAFGLDVTVVVMDASGGNVRDACWLAVVAALHDTRLPPIVVLPSEEGHRVLTLASDDDSSKVPSSCLTIASKRLVLPVLPLPLTMGLIPRSVDEKLALLDEKQTWLVDPSREEELVCQGAITVVVDGYHTEHVLSMEYQANPLSMTSTALPLAIYMAQGRAKELKELFTNPQTS